jgi:hypothetical protein
MGQAHSRLASLSKRKKKSENPGDRVTLLFVIGLLMMLGSIVTLEYLLPTVFTGVMDISAPQYVPGVLDDPYVQITLLAVTGVFGAFLLVADWALSRDRAKLTG